MSNVNQKTLENAIVVWMNEILKKGFQGEQIETLMDLHNGVIFSQLLNAVDPLFFPLDTTKALILNGKDKPTSVQKHLLDLQNRIISYRSNIQCKNDLFFVDVVQISNHNSSSQLLAYFEMVIRVILSSQMKGDLIKPILQLSEINQEALMHFLKRFMEQEEEERQNESQEEWNASMISEHNFTTLIQKTEELENDNTRLQNLIIEQKEEIIDLKQSSKYLQTLLDTKEQEYQNLMQQFYEEKHNSKDVEFNQDSQQNSEEEDRLRQRVIQQEHRIMELELTVEELKWKESQLKALRDENEMYRKQLIEQNALKHKLETLRERREVEKETQERIISQKEKTIQNLRQNIKNILNDLSIEKEKSLEFEVQLQKNQALISRLQSDKSRIEQECDDKVKSLERLITMMKEEQVETVERRSSTTNMSGSIVMDSSGHQNLENDMHKAGDSTKQDNMQLEFYKQENAKLEAKLKQLQQDHHSLQLECAEKRNDSNKDYELNITKRENEMLREESKRTKDALQKLKSSYEELKKQQSEKRPSLIDYEIELLKDLNNGLQQHAKQLKMEYSGRKDSKRD